MERLLRISALAMVGGLLTGCTPEETITTPVVPTAGVRFINAIPDTGAAYGLDLRFVDLVESNVQFRVTFRDNPSVSGGVTASTQVQYKGARAGQRHFVVFLDDTIQSIAQTKLLDTTYTFDAGTNYSVIGWGGARSGSSPSLKFTIIPETVADPGAMVALRVINTTGQAIDVRQYVVGGALPASPTWANVAPQSVSAYVNVAPGAIMYNVQPAGGGTVLFADMRAISGTPASSSAGAGGKLDTDAIPGTTVAGSAISLVVFPRSVAGTRTPQTSAFQVPSGSFIWDRRPPSIF